MAKAYADDVRRLDGGRHQGRHGRPRDGARQGPDGGQVVRGQRRRDQGGRRRASAPTRRPSATPSAARPRRSSRRSRPSTSACTTWTSTSTSRTTWRARSSTTPARWRTARRTRPTRRSSRTPWTAPGPTRRRSRRSTSASGRRRPPRPRRRASRPASSRTGSGLATTRSRTCSRTRKYGDLDARLKDELTDIDWGAAFGLKPGLTSSGTVNNRAGEQARLRPHGRQRPQDRRGAPVGDVAQIDAAKVAKEHQSIYTSDDEVENAVRNQRKEAELDVALDLGAQKARIEALARSGDLTEDQKTEQLAKWEEDSKNRETHDRRQGQGQPGQARGRVRHGDARHPVVRPADRGRDLGRVEERAERAHGRGRQAVRRGGALLRDGRCRDRRGQDQGGPQGQDDGRDRHHPQGVRGEAPGHTLDGDLLGDLSGREDLDVGHTLQYGDPDTFAKQLEEAKTPEERKKLIAGMKKMLDDRQRFEQTGTIGQIFALGADPMNSAEQLKEAVDEAETYQKALDDFQAKNPNAKPEDLAKAMADDVGLAVGQGQLRHELRRRARGPGAGAPADRRVRGRRGPGRGGRHRACRHHRDGRDRRPGHGRAVRRRSRAP